MEDRIILEYNKGATDLELSEMCDISMSTVQRKLLKLRKEDKIMYRSNTFAPKEPNLDSLLSKFELLKLFAIYKTKTAVARQLHISPEIISKSCIEHGLEDSKTKALKLNSILLDLTKDYKKANLNRQLKVDGESLVIDISDWHIGKTVKDGKGKLIYNVEIAKTRIEKLIQGMLKLLDYHLAKHIKVEEAIIICGGDMANGEGIYPTQTYDQSEAPPVQVMIVVELIMSLVLALLDRNLLVKFYGVKGNHGRLGKDADPASNWDLMAYMILKFAQREKGLKKFSVEYTEADYLSITVRNKWKYLIRHEAFAQDETSAGRAKYLGWMKLHNADVIVSHHVHHWSVNHRKIVNGSPVGGDDLSERMAVSDGKPSQLLWVATNERSHTDFYPVDLKEQEDVK